MICSLICHLFVDNVFTKYQVQEKLDQQSHTIGAAML